MELKNNSLWWFPAWVRKMKNRGNKNKKLDTNKRWQDENLWKKNITRKAVRPKKMSLLGFHRPLRHFFHVDRSGLSRVPCTFRPHFALSRVLLSLRVKKNRVKIETLLGDPKSAAIVLSNPRRRAQISSDQAHLEPVQPDRIRGKKKHSQTGETWPYFAFPSYQSITFGFVWT